MHTLHIITRCSRTKNILKVKESIFNRPKDDFEIFWHITFDTTILKDISAEILSELEHDFISLKFRKSEPGDYGHNFINITIGQIQHGWVYILDDDNILHLDLLKTISEKIEEFPDKRGFIFNQFVGGKDFSGLDMRESKPENVKVGSIDMAQFFLRRDLIGFKRLNSNEYKSDGYFIEDLFQFNQDDFLFIDKELCYYNKLQSEKMPVSLPRVLLLGENVELKSRKFYDHEEDRINVKFTESKDIYKEIINFNPDGIISIGSNYGDFPELSHSNVDIRKRWIHLQNDVVDKGEIAYQCSMSYILRGQDDDNPLVSFFTPFFNTGDKLIRTYDSLKDQTYTNWEWVLVNDSTDEGKTLKIAEHIAKSDPRVKVYDFREKSGGIVGEAKFRAASLSRGKYIMELDHDDILTKNAGKLMIEAFRRYPGCKFVFSDCAEIDENHNSLTYGDGFSFGYGKYRTEHYNGRDYQVAVCQNMNPITTRHIVGVPNHFRAWDREFYHSIGGHNRRLSIADDYELILRSFLKTRFVGIRKLLYLQFYHNSDTLNNTQNSSRADIQRRVRTIAQFYNEDIKNRFEELGIEDYAYNTNPQNPLITKPRYNELECPANFIWDPDDNQ